MKQVMKQLLALFGCLLPSLVIGAGLSIDRIELCRGISGDGRCDQQAYQSYSPGSRLWIRADLSGFNHDKDHIDLNMTLEIQAPDARVIVWMRWT